jgi:hypothetical protein
MRDTVVKLGGESWEIRFVRRRDLPKDRVGECDWNSRVIRVRKDLCRKTVLDTLIHEMRHAQHPVMFEAEEFITNTSTELAIGLIATGLVD